MTTTQAPPSATPGTHVAASPSVEDRLDHMSAQVDELVAEMTQLYPTELSVATFDHPGDLDDDQLIEAFATEADANYSAREEEIGVDTMRELERTVVL